MSLRISSDLTLPLSAVTQTFAILAKRRVGKTYTASVMAEEFVNAGIPFVALDPTGAWWGLRASANGKADGLPVVIIGGAHGDVPLEHTAGKVIADLVVDHPGYYVVDMSQTNSDAEQDKFAADFAERLYRRKESSRHPLHLFIDEADSFAPQTAFPQQKRMLGAFEALVRRGGIRGIGTTLITQRPAVLNKNVLTQAEVLIVLQMTGPHDKKAIDAWVKDNGEPEKRDMLMQSLASLQKGEAWFWSPSWMEVFKKIQIRERVTFNSSATPEANSKAVVPVKLATVDLERLGAEIKSTIERAKEQDPAALRRKISELQQQLKKAEAVKPIPAPIPLPVLSPAHEEMLSSMRVACSQLKHQLEELTTALDRVQAPKTHVARVYAKAPVQPEQFVRKPVAMPKPVPRVEPIENNGSLGKCESSILKVLMQYPQGRSDTQLAILTNYSVTSGGFKNSLGHLRSLEFITRTHPIQITEAGKAHIGDDWEPLPTGPDLHRIWLNRLAKCEALILENLIDVYPEAMTMEELAQKTSYSVTSGGFKNSLGRLRTLELIKRGQPIKASDNLFQ